MALELNPVLELRIRDHAARQGLTVEQLIERSLPEERLPRNPIVIPMNERLIATLKKIKILNEGRPITSDGSDTKRLLRDARDGAMYNLDPIE